MSVDLTPRTTHAYEPQLAYLFSQISTWSYANQDTLCNVLEHEDVAHRRPSSPCFFSVTNPALPVDAQGYLLSFGDAFHVLSFRGTEITQFLDMLTDALVEKHKWNGSPCEWVHRGFFLSLNVMWPEIERKLAACKGSLYITGHSLGGAIAVLASRRFFDRRERFDGLDLHGVYTYGQPMVGNRDFANRCPEDLPLYRHVFEHDVVPRLPPTGIGADDYAHFGKLYVSEGKTRTAKRWELSEHGGAPKPCHASEILPSLMTLITARAMRRNIPLAIGRRALHAAGLELMGATWSARAIKDAIAGVPRLFTGTDLSLDDHIPTHYVDVSKMSYRNENTRAT